MAGAVHRFQRVDALFLGALFVDLDDEHVLAVGLPMARLLPQHAIDDLRRLDFLVTRAAQPPAHVVLKLAVDRPAVRMPEHHARRFFLQMEQLHLAAQLAVVALGGLFQHRHMRLQVVAVLERNAVDALEHRARGIAQPVGPRHMRQLERIRRNLPRVLQMRPPAQVLPVAMPVHPQILIFRDPVDQLQLEGFAPAPVILHCTGPLPHFRPHRIARVDDLFHPRFDLAQILGRERLLPVEVVEPAVIPHRPDGDLHLRPDFLHRPRHDVRKVVPDQFQSRSVVLDRVQRDGGVARDRPGQIPVRAVDLRRDRRLGQRRRNARRNFGGRYPCRILADVAVGKCQ